MPTRRGNASPREPWWRSDESDSSYDGASFYEPRVPTADGRRAAGRPGRVGRRHSHDGDLELGERLTLPSIPRMPSMDRRGDESDAPRIPDYSAQVPLREPSIMVPGKDSGKFATAKRTDRVPAVRDAHRASTGRYPARSAGDDWEAAEQWQSARGWDEPVPERALAPMLTGGAPPSRPLVRPPVLPPRRRRMGAGIRYLLVLVAAIVALTTTFAATGQLGAVFAAFNANATSKHVQVVAEQVHPITSLLHPEQFDSTAQFNSYGGASCSPTVLAEVLTAWGVPNATIGHMIDDLGSYLSPSDGLLDQQGFQVVAAKYGFRADISWHLTYNQMLYLANTLGIPVIVNFRACSGYYYDLCGGHFLVVTRGDQNGVNVVDSSEYYMKYLGRSTFDNLWYWRGDGTAMTVVIVPQSYQYTLPNV
jgi:hypothetical protein